jgi:hypothetical protein
MTNPHFFEFLFLCLHQILGKIAGWCVLGWVILNLPTHIKAGQILKKSAIRICFRESRNPHFAGFYKSSGNLWLAIKVVYSKSVPVGLKSVFITGFGLM